MKVGDLVRLKESQCTRIRLAQQLAENGIHFGQTYFVRNVQFNCIIINDNEDEWYSMDRFEIVRKMEYQHLGYASEQDNDIAWEFLYGT